MNLHSVIIFLPVNGFTLQSQQTLPPQRFLLQLFVRQQLLQCVFNWRTFLFLPTTPPPWDIASHNWKFSKNNIKYKYVAHHFLILNIWSSSQALIRICSEMNDYNRENSIVFLMGNLTWSYGWCSTSHRVHCGLEYWWRRMSLRITDLQNPIWTSLHLVFDLSYICIQVLVV